MKNKIDNTIEFKPKENDFNNSKKDSFIKNQNNNSTCKVIPYSKQKKIKHIKSKINTKVGKFEKQHPILIKYKPIIILFIIILIISIISSLNTNSLKNTYGFNSNLNTLNPSYFNQLCSTNLNTFG